MKYPNLKAEMARRGFTGGDIAFIIGRQQGAVSRKLNGKSDFTTTEAILIQKALGVDIPLEKLFEKED